MVWGVRYLQEAHGFDYGEAVMRSATVPIGWIIGCPLLGFLSDRLGRRKPVIIAGGLVLLACLAWILYGPVGVLPPYLLGLVAGTASGAAMLPYTVIKEANPPKMSGTSTGVSNFINFTFSALLGPVFAGLLSRASGLAERDLADAPSHGSHRRCRRHRRRASERRGRRARERQRAHPEGHAVRRRR
jgi:MFS family permease